MRHCLIFGVALVALSALTVAEEAIDPLCSQRVAEDLGAATGAGAVRLGDLREPRARDGRDVDVGDVVAAFGIPFSSHRHPLSCGARAEGAQRGPIRREIAFSF